MLLVEGAPRFEYRFLRNLLGRDKTIELAHALAGGRHGFQRPGQDAGDAEKVTTLKIFPVRREDLAAYDVVIFGDVNPSLLSPAALQNLADFVDHADKGGALVLRGRSELHAAGLPRHAAGPADAVRSGQGPQSRARTSRSRKGSSPSRPRWGWPARRCNWATRRSSRRPSGRSCRRCTG